MQGVEANEQQPIAAGRACGACTLCCKVYDVPEAETIAGAWCRHCAPGSGCRIWENRPKQCRDFHCLWLTQDWLGPEWKPDRAKIVFTTDPTGQFLKFQVDPGSPNAWKREPYYSDIKRWAIEGLKHRRCTIVYHNKSATLVLPDREEQIGVIEAGDRLNVIVGRDGKIEVKIDRAQP